MVDFPLNKSNVEQIPFCSFVVSWQNVNAYWATESHQKQFEEVVKNIQDSLMHDQNLAFVATLRAIIVTDDMPSLISQWANDIEPEHHFDPSRTVRVVGKNYTWVAGDEYKAGNIFSVILLDQDIAYGCVNENTLCKAMLAHELSHTHEGLLRRVGTEYRPIVASDDWPNIQRTFSKISWAEFFACKSSAICFPEAPFEDDEILIYVIEEAIKSLDPEKKMVQITGQVDTLWVLALSRIQDVITQSGRFAGTTPSGKVESLYFRIKAINPDLERAIHSFCVELTKIDHSQLKEDSFASLDVS
ncbi:MAG: hypothetical protein AAF787_15580, partial [Chloroflexota bacterium]